MISFITTAGDLLFLDPERIVAAQTTDADEHFVSYVTSSTVTNAVQVIQTPEQVAAMRAMHAAVSRYFLEEDGCVLNYVAWDPEADAPEVDWSVMPIQGMPA